MDNKEIIHLAPLEFIHLVDYNTNITRIEVGPRTVVLRSNERLSAGPLKHIIIPLGSYCVILDPVVNYVRGEACYQLLGQSDVRFHGEPFPLYPGERLDGAPEFGKSSPDYRPAIKKLPVIKAGGAIKLEAIIDHTADGKLLQAGDRWQLHGPLTYKPTPEVRIIGMVKPVIIRYNQALRLRAEQDFTQQDKVKRVTAEEWIVTEPGAYLPGTYEEVMAIEDANTLTRDTGLHLRANQSLIDSTGVERQTGQEWLLTGEQQELFLPKIGVEIIKSVRKTVVPKGKYCVVINPIGEDGKSRFGEKVLHTGCCSFFLHPGELLECGIQKAYILGADEALVIHAKEKFVDSDEKETEREPGDRWMIRGPRCYIPQIEAETKNRIQMIPLDKNEGIYVRDTQTGSVRLVMGPQSYMLSAFEELHEKELSETCELLLRQGGGDGKGDIRKMAYYDQSIDPAILKGRNKSRVVTYRCPINTAVQVFNYEQKTARVVFGPDLVILGPSEDFNILSLSAGKPKKPDALKSLCLMLGPDFISDILEVETSDHARLRIQMSFNDYFKFDKDDIESEQQIFSVPDFIGYACQQVGSRIRAKVALTTFDDFHRHSAQVIQLAVFGQDENRKLRKELIFKANNLVVTSIDIQSIEPVDVKMRDSLLKSVQLAIEISTNSVEASATHEASRCEQVARGELERQKLDNEIESEKERSKLLELCAMSAAVESSGQAKAEAHAQAERMIIECQSEIEATTLKAQAGEIEHYSNLETQAMSRTGELDYTRRLNELEISKARNMSNIETDKFDKMVKAIGAKTIQAIATSGPDMKVKLLQGLGINSVLVTNGNNPLNMFQTANGLISQEH